MSIWAKQEISLHIKEVRCLASHPSGNYALRFHLFYKSDERDYFAIPVSIMQAKQSSKGIGNELGQTSYTTRSFLMKPNQQISVDEVCIFKNQVNILKYEPDYNDLTLVVICEVLRIDHKNKQTVSGIFEGKLFGASVSDFLLIDIYEASACQVLGSIHSCIYQYQYISKNPKFSTFQNYCDSQSPEYVEQLLRYLLKEGKSNLARIKKLAAMYGLKSELKQIQMPEKMLEKKQEKQLFQSIKAHSKLILEQEQKVQKDLETRPEQIVTDIEEQKLKNIRRKRKKIFSKKSQPIELKPDTVTIEEFEKILHENAQIVYQMWREFLTIFFKKQYEKTFKEISTEYEKKVKKLMGESVVRFKGQWDTDPYAKELTQRNKMAYQARTLLGESSKETNEFCFYNSSFFSQSRPIFFEEFIPSLQPEKNQLLNHPKVIIFLVHGLGACRLDMERLKVQLKRYYRDRVHIMVSIANEGRTEGDIDAMGARFASEVEHELSKLVSVPPITFIGHSMGGLIIRSALPRLNKFSKYFNSFITFSTPHVGFAYSDSKLIDAGLWLVNSWKKCRSILQLTMNDEKTPQECFLYKLSQQKGLEWFRKIGFYASHQDLYVPYYSARIQKSPECTSDWKKKFEKGIVHNEMINSLLNQINGTIIRTDVNFCIPEQNLDNLIGRAAHISFLQSNEMLRLFCVSAENLIF